MVNIKKTPLNFAEERIIQEEQSSIISNFAQFKQPIPTNFVELNRPQKNNWGSTEGLNKPLCERYLFSVENKRIYLDIPQELMAKLELPEGVNCPWPFYLARVVLERE